MNVQEIRLPWLWNRARGQNAAEANPSDRPIGGLVDYDSSHNRYFVNAARTSWWEWFEMELTFRQLLQSWPFIQGHVLEMADGNKPFWLFFHHLSTRYASIDFSGVNKKTEKSKASPEPARLTLKPASLDTVVIWKVPPGLKNPGEFVKQIHESLKPDGRIIMLLQHGPSSDGAGDFSVEALHNLLGLAGFQIEFERSFWGKGAVLLQKVNKRIGRTPLFRRILAPLRHPWLRLEQAYLDFWQKKNLASGAAPSEKGGQFRLSSLIVGLKTQPG